MWTVGSVCRVLLLLGGSIPIMAATQNRPDAMYTTGPETAIFEAKTILTGYVSGYARHVLSTSEPSGPDAMALKWIASGRVERPVALKGHAMGPLSFHRKEQSAWESETPSLPLWELAYDEVQPAGEVVLFFGDDSTTPTAVVPSEPGELDLVSLVRDAVGIQANSPEAQTAAWLAYIETAKTDSGRKAGLRSLLRANVDWGHMQPVLERMFANRTLSEPMRTFTFGIVAFGLTNSRWAGHQPEVAAFLGEQLTAARSLNLALQYILAMKLDLRFAMEGEKRALIRAPLVAALKENESRLAASPQIAEQYRQLRISYPGVF